jgi:hypothetical protein
MMFGANFREVGSQEEDTAVSCTIPQPAQAAYLCTLLFAEDGETRAISESQQQSAGHFCEYKAASKGTQSFCGLLPVPFSAGPFGLNLTSGVSLSLVLEKVHNLCSKLS